MNLFFRAALSPLCAVLFFISLCSGSVFANQSYEELDYLEPVNRVVFKFNDKADEYVLKPVAQAYKYVAPGFVNEGITNFFNNISDVKTFANSLLQLKFHNAIVTLNRVIYNTTFGLGGFIDVATYFGLRNNEEDFGQTLGYWGYENSTYIVLPFLGPSTVRDLAGRAVDMTTFDPLEYIDEIHEDTALLSTGVKLIDKRADLLGAEHLLFGSDRYRFMRNAFLQNREYVIKDGEVADPFADEDSINYDDF